MIYFILALLIVVCIVTQNDNKFTIKCDRCGSTDVVATSNGIKCHNCGAECKN